VPVREFVPAERNPLEDLPPALAFLAHPSMPSATVARLREQNRKATAGRSL
jgi:hypothetical protein